MEYKWSKYNLPLASNDKSNVIFNTQSGAICNIENEILSQYMIAQILAEYNLPYFEEFLDMGYIVPIEEDSLNSACKKFDDKTLRIVLMCTSACNLRCYYCFEKEHKQSSFFDCEKIDSFIKYLSAMLDLKNYRKLDIVWFGGEPLLYINQIVEYSRILIDICNQKNVEYNASIITNATLATIETIILLKKAKINKIQVSFDGNLDKFIQYKKGNSEQWRKIIDFIRNIVNHISVVLRFNLDSRNFDSVKAVFKELSNFDLLQRCKIIIAKINLRNTHSHYINYKRFYDDKLKLISYLCHELNVDNDTLWDELENRNCACALIGEDAIVIDSCGYCHKCEDDVGEESNFNIYELESCVRLTDMNSSSIHQQCPACVVYPICRGECPKHWNYNDCNDKIEYIKKLALLKLERQL